MFEEMFWILRSSTIFAGPLLDDVNQSILMYELAINQISIKFVNQSIKL